MSISLLGFAFEDIPYDTMWLDDELWYPMLLGRRNFRGYVYFRGA
jgi:hypothetical protein